MKDQTVEATKSAMDQMIKEYVAQQGFMGCVLISKDDKLLLKESYGFANLEWEIPNSPSTRFQIAIAMEERYVAPNCVMWSDAMPQCNDTLPCYTT